MISPVKAAQLSGFLGGLPGAIALRLAKAVEVDRLAGGSVLPHDVILDALRPALRGAQSEERTPTPLRLFCEPFADLLTAAPRKEKRKGRIARDSVVPVWIWVSKTLVPASAADYIVGIKNAVLTYKPDEAQALASGFWTVAADAIQAAIAKDRKDARAALGSETVVDDAEEIALLLSGGRDIADLQEKFPRHSPMLTENTIWILRGIYDHMLQSVPDVASYMPVIVMSRMAHPWEALKLPLHISRQTSDTLISSTDMGLAGEVLLGDLEEHAAAIRVARHPMFDAEDLAQHVQIFSKLSTGMSQEVELRRDGTWHQRLMKDRTAVADTMQALMERAPREILAALPVAKTGSYGGGPKSPDVSRAPDLDKSTRGLRYARLVTACRPCAGAASFGASQKDAQNEASVHLKGYSDDIVKELRAATDPAKRAIVEQYFNLAVDFTVVLFSAEEAEFLRRRGRAAMADGNAGAAAA